MKKTLLITTGAIVILAIAGAAYWLGTRSTANNNSNGAGNQNIAQSNTNQPTPQVTYVPFSGSTAGYTFDTISEWVSIAPSEVEKSMTVEQRHGYDLVYYSTNPDALIFAISEKSVPDGATTLTDIVTEDMDTIRADYPDVSGIETRINDWDALTEKTLTISGREYTIFNRYLGLPQSGDSIFRWVLVEVAVPVTQISRYQAVIDRLSNSLRLMSADINT